MNTELYQHLFNNRDKFKVADNQEWNGLQVEDGSNNPIQDANQDWSFLLDDGDGPVYSRPQAWSWGYEAIQGDGVIEHRILCDDEVCQLDEPMTANSVIDYAETENTVYSWIEVI